MRRILEAMEARGCRMKYYRVGPTMGVCKVAALFNPQDSPIVRLIIGGAEPDRETTLDLIEEMLVERAGFLLGTSPIHAPITRRI